jgi:predicted amidophosphoribosyltransferase
MKLASPTPPAPRHKPAKRPKTRASRTATIFSSAVEMRGRERHFPRLCDACQAPMAVQEDNCWHCGAMWGASHPAKSASHTAKRPSHTAKRAKHVADRAVAA